jgi:uncharacterized membrane protein YeaQ/YmgE (transglycosylase-associated protein family)
VNKNLALVIGSPLAGSILSTLLEDQNLRTCSLMTGIFGGIVVIIKTIIEIQKLRK